jgi:adenylate cyclase
MTGDPAQECFCDGISGDIITDLSKINGLAVIGRQSAFAYKGKANDLRTVGRELGVRYVLEGSVRLAANRVRVNAQLIEADTGTHVWAKRYDRELKDVFLVGDEITEDIVSSLDVKLGRGEEADVRAANRADFVGKGAHRASFRPCTNTGSAAQSFATGATFELRGWRDGSV